MLDKILLELQVSKIEHKELIKRYVVLAELLDNAYQTVDLLQERLSDVNQKLAEVSSKLSPTFLN